MTIDLDDADALVTHAKRVAENRDDPLVEELVDALESTLAELRQERERADEDVQRLAETFNENLALKAALSRAEETIEKALGATDMAGEWVIWDSGEAYDILTEYSEQKGADRG